MAAEAHGKRWRRKGCRRVEGASRIKGSRAAAAAGQMADLGQSSTGDGYENIYARRERDVRQGRRQAMPPPPREHLP